MLITDWKELAEDISGIYCIGIRKNGRDCYIGSSIDIRERIKGHLKALKRNMHTSEGMQTAFNDELRLQIFILEKINVENRCNLIEREQYYFDKLSPLWNNTLYAWAPMQDPEIAARQSKNMKITASDPNYRKMRSTIMKKAMNDPAVRKQLSISRKLLMQDPVERLKVSETTKLAMKRPSVRKRFIAGIERRSNNLEHGAAISRKAKERMQDPIERKKISEGVKKAYQNNPELSANISRKAKKRMQDLDVRRQIGLKQKEVWERLSDEERRDYRKKMSISHGGDGRILTKKQEEYILNHLDDENLILMDLARKFDVPYHRITQFVKKHEEQPRSQKDVWSNTKLRKQHSTKQKSIWKNPELKARHSQALRDAWKRRKEAKRY